MKPTKSQIESAAAAIANERGGRRGMPPITNVLDLLPDNLREEVIEDARAALEAAIEQRIECDGCGVITTAGRAEFVEGDGGLVPIRWFCRDCQERA